MIFVCVKILVVIMFILVYKFYNLFVDKLFNVSMIVKNYSIENGIGLLRKDNFSVLDLVFERIFMF